MTLETPIKIILIDDHPWVHEIITKILESDPLIQLVAYGNNGQDAVRLCEVYKPDLVLMDVMMPVMGGAEATQLIHKRYPNIKILILTSFRDDDSVRVLLKNGAAGYVLKDSLQNELASTIRAAYRGMTVVSQEVSQVLLKTSDAPKNDFGLTGREQEVLSLMGKGLNHAEIAAQLVISQSTVRFHITNILEKLHVETRAEAIVIAAKNNLI